MRDNELSPEERLLRLIKKSKTESAFGPEEKVKLPKEKKAPPDAGEEDISQYKGLLVREKKEPEPVREEKKEESAGREAGGKKEEFPPKIEPKLGRKTSIPHIRYIYALIAVVVFFLLLIFFFSVLSGRETDELKRLGDIVDKISKPDEEKSLQAEQKGAREDRPAEEGRQGAPAASFEDYQKLIDEKSIFASPVKEKTKTEVPTAVTLRELTKNLRLVGVVPGDEPQAIIEDKLTGQTLFLKKGDMVGYVEIVDISSGRITLKLGEETTTLSL